MNSRLAVIIPHKDDPTRLELCLGLLLSQEVPADEILVVDNGSRDFPAIEAIGRKHAVRLLPCAEGGSYRARNLGIDSTDAEILVFTDADCRPCRGYIRAYRAWAANRCERLIAAGPVDVFSQATPNAWELIDTDSGYPQREYVARGKAMTANVCVRREGIRRFGAFDAKLYSGGDVEFTSRIAAGAGGIDWVEEARVGHPARHSRAEHVERMKRIFQGSAAKHLQAGRAPVGPGGLLKLLLPPVRKVRRIASSTPGRPLVVASVLMRLMELRLRQFAYTVRLMRSRNVTADGGKYR